jgi:hypothetical protein
MNFTSGLARSTSEVFFSCTDMNVAMMTARPLLGSQRRRGTGGGRADPRADGRTAVCAPVRPLPGTSAQAQSEGARRAITWGRRVGEAHLVPARRQLRGETPAASASGRFLCPLTAAMARMSTFILRPSKSTEKHSLLPASADGHLPKTCGPRAIMTYDTRAITTYDSAAVDGLLGTGLNECTKKSSTRALPLCSLQQVRTQTVSQKLYHKGKEAGAWTFTWKNLT